MPVLPDTTARETAREAPPPETPLGSLRRTCDVLDALRVDLESGRDGSDPARVRELGTEIRKLAAMIRGGTPTRAGD